MNKVSCMQIWWGKLQNEIYWRSSWIILSIAYWINKHSRASTMCQAQLDLVRKKIKQGPCCEGVQSKREDRYYLLNATFEVREGVWKQGGCPWLNLLLREIREGCPREMTSEPSRIKPNQIKVRRAIYVERLTWAEAWGHEKTWHIWGITSRLRLLERKVMGRERGKRWVWTGRQASRGREGPTSCVKEYKLYPEGSHWRILSRLDLHLD